MAVILAAQTVLSARLIPLGIASAGESLSIYGGHQIIHGLWHGGASPYYETYFSGVPVLYPVLAAMADGAGGLVAARLLSLASMLAATGLLFAAGRRVLGYWPAVAAAGLFASLGTTQLLGAYASGRPMSLMLMAAAVYAAVRAAGRGTSATRWLLAIPVLLLVANAVKYTSVLFDPVVVGIGATAIGGYGWLRMCQRAAALSASTLLAIAVALIMGGSGYLRGIAFTALGGPPDAQPAALRQPGGLAGLAGLLGRAWDWPGLLICLGVLAIVAVSPLAARRRGLGPLLVVAGLALAAGECERLSVVAPVSTSSDFAAWFACLGGGLALARLVGAEQPGSAVRRWRGRALAVTAAVALPAVAAAQAAQSVTAITGANALIPQAVALRPYLASPSRNYLLTGPETEAIPYFLGLAIPWNHLFDGNYIRYPVPGHPATHLSGLAGFRAAIHGHYFAVVSITAQPFPWAHAELQAVQSTPGYDLVSTTGGLTYVDQADYLRPAPP